MLSDFQFIARYTEASLDLLARKTLNQSDVLQQKLAVNY